jgi:hypothetical protein
MKKEITIKKTGDQPVFFIVISINFCFAFCPPLPWKELGEGLN